MVLDKELAPEAHAKAEAARPEYVVAAIGTVRRRDASLVNPRMDTGEIEVVATELLLLNEAKTPPFSPAEDAIANEEVRLKYRYLDLRRVEMQKNFRLRHEVTRSVRNYLSDHGFLEIETPFMTRSTPEGARDYLVPSRVHPGHFYALPQSPQIFKQILMVSGFDRYFQIARCFRDEDLRADPPAGVHPDRPRNDLPAAGHHLQDHRRVPDRRVQGCGHHACASVRRMTYDDAIRNYGIDKPDMRLPAMVDLSAILTAERREALKIEQALPVLGFIIPAAGIMSGTQKRALVDEIRKFFGDCGLDFLDIARLKTNADFVMIAEDIQNAFADALDEEWGLNPAGGEELMIVITPKLGTPAMWNFDPQWIYKKVGGLRLELAKKFADKHGRHTQTNTAADFKFCWVTDFPMYEWDEQTKTWQAAHHPFTSPHEDDIKAGRLTSDKGAVRALAYDIVLNGTELGSGSIRIHRKDVQAEIFRSLGMDEAEQKARFGFFLDALEYGTPAAWRHRARPRPHRDDSRWREQPARGHRLPEDGQGYRPDGRRADGGERTAAPRPEPAHRDPQLILPFCRSDVERRSLPFAGAYLRRVPRRGNSVGDLCVILSPWCVC